MNKEQAKKWADALRSGKFEQCRYTLEDNKKYCCLGVAAVVLDLHEKDMLTYPSHAEVMSKYEESIFIKMNDEEKKSFLEIADKVEEIYLKEDA